MNYDVFLIFCCCDCENLNLNVSKLKLLIFLNIVDTLHATYSKYFFFKHFNTDSYINNSRQNFILSKHKILF